MFGYQLYYSTTRSQPKQNGFFYKIYGVIHVEERIRFLHVSKLVKQRVDSPVEIPDVRSGNGNYAFYLGKSFPAARITAVDISKENMDTASLFINVN